MNRQNSTFVLLHNVAQFDYQHTRDGLALYDWASFRNLLKDGESTLGGTHMKPITFRLPTHLVADHPMRVIERLLNDHPAYRLMAADPWANERASTTYELLGELVCVESLGI